MTSNKIGVFPAAGGIGGSTAKHLIHLLPAKDLVFIARYPEKLQFATSVGATVRQADYDDDKTLNHAFDGIDTLFLISYASVEYEYRVQAHRRAINFALTSGVKYIFYGSLGFAGKEDNKQTVAHVMRAHIDTELYLEECTKTHPGFAYTVIREGLYAESYPMYTSFFDLKNPTDEIKIPHDGSGPGIAWVKREELGEGSAELIKGFVKNQDAFKYRNKTVLLSGPKLYTLKETVDVLSRIVRKPVRIRQVSDDEFAAQPQVSRNFTYRGVDLSKPWATAFEAFRRGEAAVVSPLLGQLLGREPEDFEMVVSRPQNDTPFWERTDNISTGFQK